VDGIRVVQRGCAESMQVHKWRPGCRAAPVQLQCRCFEIVPKALTPLEACCEPSWSKGCHRQRGQIREQQQRGVR
jgi:hypothetical protein